ncbi:histidine kinase dimerization/phosphoacceptor domain -containing protein [Sulfurimonas sp. HSL1-2]|uniref:sensor histidine kinase n=1 Tax=Thiomicrolovo zhangzhouensis TaxID=3131933 RepID=UPI0031F81D5D
MDQTYIGFSDRHKAKIQAAGFAFAGVIGVAIVDRISIGLTQIKADTYGLPFLIGVLFFLLSATFLYSLLRKTAMVAEKAQATLAACQREEKEELQLFNFALDNSADAIYWFTFDTRFFYVNDAACKMLGYSKEELLQKKLCEIDPNSNLNSRAFLEEIKARGFVCFESIQIRKDGSRFPASVSTNYFCNGTHEFVCAFGRDITEQKAKEKIIIEQNSALKHSLEEKEALIKEIHHRVKNNLEVISSLLQMQNRRETDRHVKEALSKSQSRIFAIALVHEMLYKNSGLATIDMKQHLERLSGAMMELYDPSGDIAVHVEAENVSLSMDNAVLVALIVHELFLNAIKHAFKGAGRGEIRIFIRHAEDGSIYFGVRDNGVGFDPKTTDMTNTLGCQLINSITEFQLNGTIAVVNDNGFCCTIRFTPSEQGSK